MKNISSNDLLTIYLRNQNIIIIDVRSPLEFARGHIPNSININIDRLCLKYLLYLNENYTYYLICKDGSRSKIASKKLSKFKFNVINISDGISSWQGPIEKDRFFN